MHVFCEMPLNENKPLTEKVGNLFPFVFRTFGAQAITIEDGNNNDTWQKASNCTLAFVCKKRDLMIRSSRFWEQTFSHVIGNRSNSKRARTKFKLTGKFKILRKLKQQKAFLACSLSFFAHLFVFVSKATLRGKVIIKKNSRIWDGTQTFIHQISNSKRARTKFKLIKR